MAAIFALVFVPTLAAVLFMVGAIHGGMTLATCMAGLVFVALSSGMLVGLFRLARQWDDERST